MEQDNGPIGVALLFDISGSMDVNDRYDRAREQGYFLLSGLRNGEDEAAIFAFDSRVARDSALHQRAGSAARHRSPSSAAGA